MQYELSLPYRQNISDYTAVQAAIKSAVAASTGTSPSNVVVASSQQKELCSTPIQPTSSALPFMKEVVFTSLVDGQESGYLRGRMMDKDLDMWTSPISLAATRTKKSTISFAIFSGVQGKIND